MHSAASKLLELHLQPEGSRPPDRDAQVRAWLQWLQQLTGLKTTPLAKEAGLSPSTLLRAMDEDNPVSLEWRSINKIVNKFNVAGPDTFQMQGSYAPHTAVRIGFSDMELEKYTAEMQSLTPTQGRWQVRTRALELAGYLPGDNLIADSIEIPRAEDVVIAQHLHTGKPGADTVLRLYDPPYLLTATLDEHAKRKPLLVDNANVSIWGVVVKSWRERS